MEWKLIQSLKTKKNNFYIMGMKLLSIIKLKSITLSNIVSDYTKIQLRFKNDLKYVPKNVSLS